jgi:hypothetical protein
LNTRSIQDKNYIKLENLDNQKISQNILQNFRTSQFTHNKQYYFPQLHTLYDLQGIYTGRGAGMNPSLDTKLRYSTQVNLPADKLSNYVTFQRYVDYLPSKQISYAKFNTNTFLLATTVSNDPQRYFSSEFDRIGINTHHYLRLSDKTWKNFNNKKI